MKQAVSPWEITFLFAIAMNAHTERLREHERDHTYSGECDCSLYHACLTCIRKCKTKSICLCKKRVTVKTPLRRALRYAITIHSVGISTRSPLSVSPSTVSCTMRCRVFVWVPGVCRIHCERGRAHVSRTLCKEERDASPFASSFALSSNTSLYRIVLFGP